MKPEGRPELGNRGSEGRRIKAIRALSDHLLLIPGKEEDGIDIACDVHTPVKAVLDGTVDLVEESSASGKTVRLRHSGELATSYLHLSQIFVSTGQEVQQGEIVALSGDTGRSTGPHLHFEVQRQGKPVDPLTALENMEFQICRP